MSGLGFIPVDDRAKDGRAHTLRDEVGHLWCGKWHRGRWVLAGKKECGLVETVAVGAPIQRAITEYVGRI